MRPVAQTGAICTDGRWWSWNAACSDCRNGMLDREKVVAVLKRRFPGSAVDQVAAAANAIIGLEDEWVEVLLPEGGWDRWCPEG